MLLQQKLKLEVPSSWYKGAKWERPNGHISGIPSLSTGFPSGVRPVVPSPTAIPLGVIPWVCQTQLLDKFCSFSGGLGRVYRYLWLAHLPTAEPCLVALSYLLYLTSLWSVRYNCCTAKGKGGIGDACVWVIGWQCIGDCYYILWDTFM